MILQQVANLLQCSTNFGAVALARGPSAYLLDMRQPNATPGLPHHSVTGLGGTASQKKNRHAFFYFNVPLCEIPLSN